MTMIYLYRHRVAVAFTRIGDRPLGGRRQPSAIVRRRSTPQVARARSDTATGPRPRVLVVVVP